MAALEIQGPTHAVVTTCRVNMVKRCHKDPESLGSGRRIAGYCQIQLPQPVIYEGMGLVV